MSANVLAVTDSRLGPVELIAFGTPAQAALSPVWAEKRWPDTLNHPDVTAIVLHRNLKPIEG
jgi:hypothetical protein